MQTAFADTHHQNQPVSNIINLANYRRQHEDSLPIHSDDWVASLSEPTPKSKEERADPLMSCQDIQRVMSRFLYKNNYRDYALFTTGLATGLRVSDLCILKTSDLFTIDAMDNGLYTWRINIKSSKYFRICCFFFP